MGVPAEISVEDFATQAEEWLGTRLERRQPATEQAWGEGELDVSVFHALTLDAERAYLDSLLDWVRAKAECGYHAITWPRELGGLGLSRSHARAFGRLERRFVTPGVHESVSVTRTLVETQGHDRLHHRDGLAGDRHTTDPTDEWRLVVLRGVLQRRASP